MKHLKVLSAAAIAVTITLPVAANAGKPVNIAPGQMSVSVKHNGATVEISRNQDNKNTVIPAFAKTSRPCPPFCIQPSILAPGVETIAEREIMDYAARMSGGDSSIVLVDSRTPIGWSADRLLVRLMFRGRSLTPQKEQALSKSLKFFRMFST